jgi:hypothetical protein
MDNQDHFAALGPPDCACRPAAHNNCTYNNLILLHIKLVYYTLLPVVSFLSKVVQRAAAKKRVTQPI